MLVALQWFSFGALMPLALLGAWMTRAAWRRLWILYASFVTLMLSVVIFYVLARYRLSGCPYCGAVCCSGAGALEAVA